MARAYIYVLFHDLDRDLTLALDCNLDHDLALDLLRAGTHFLKADQEHEQDQEFTRSIIWRAWARKILKNYFC